LPGGLQAVHTRHEEIEDDQIRAELLGFLYRFASIHSFSANLPPGVLAKKRRKALPDQRAIIDDKNAVGHKIIW
jgi:hypothetical protein